MKNNSVLESDKLIHYKKKKNAFSNTRETVVKMYQNCEQ